MMNDSAETNLTRIRRAAYRARWITAGLLLIMFVGTHVPTVAYPSLFSLPDKLLHAAGYMALTVSVLTSWELSVGLLRPQHYFTVWLLGTLYGALDEITQIPVGRTCDGLDWLADIVGIVLGLTLFRVSRSLIYRFV